jgi:hypothetical protein
MADTSCGCGATNVTDRYGTVGAERDTEYVLLLLLL